MIPDGLAREVIFGEVVAKANHYQAVPDGKGGKRIIKDKAIRAYEKEFCRQVVKYRHKNISSRFVLHVEVYYCNSQHDLDNSLKTILDCLQYSHAISNDVYCVAIHAEKHRDTKKPRVVFAIEEKEPTLL